MTEATLDVTKALSVTTPPREGASSDDGDDTPGKKRDAIDHEAFKNGEDEAFRAVLDRFAPLIRKMVRPYADSDDEREDLYQEVSIRLLEQRGKYRKEGSMAGWVGTVAHHVARNWCASRSARESAMDSYASATVPIEAADHITNDPSRLLNFKDLLANVELALDAIPERQAEAFRLVQVNGYSAKQAAKILEVKTATVRSNVRHARKKLRKQFHGLE